MRTDRNVSLMYDILTDNNQKIKENLSKFFLQLYLMDIDMNPDKVDYLKRNGYLSPGMLGEEDKGLAFSDNYRSFREISSSPLSEYFDEDLTHNQILTLEEGLRMESKNYKFNSTLNICKEDWTPTGLKHDYEVEFWQWINTINSGWQYFKPYSKFNKYREQAYNWIAEGIIIDKNASRERKIEYLRIERYRMLTNSLYTLNKFGFIKNEDTNDPRGKKYVAWEAQEVMLYLFDLGLSFIMGKARQIGATTTIGAATAIKTGLRKNFNTKMVAEKGDKSEELFRDKVKYVVDKFPDYLTPSISNDSGDLIRFVNKIGKGKTSGPDSIFSVEPPTRTCINGGSPAIVLLDEIGLYDMFGGIMAEARPTLFAYNEESGRQEMRRQIIAWGTGGNMDKGGGAMEQEFTACEEAWKSRDFSNGLIPLFLNCFARKGVDRKFYEDEKRVAYSKPQKTGDVDNKIVFHQSLPVTKEDMFLISSDTIIPIVTIDRKLADCRVAKSRKERLFIRGHFVPVYDTSIKMTEGSDVPYKVIGAKFVPAGDNDIIENSPSACATILMKPDLDYKNRYYKGTDPIFTSSGHSNFSSSIWDDLEKDFAAYIDMRHEDYRYCYFQSLLMNLYYSRIEGGQAVGIKELVESNVGGEYINYVKDKGYYRILIKQDKLPEVLHNGGAEIGIRKAFSNGNFIINQLETMLVKHIDTIHHDRMFEQLKTYVRKLTKQSKNFVYAPQNPKLHKDDALDGSIYSYIAKECYPNLRPQKVDSADETRMVKRYKLDSNYNITLVNQRLGSGRPRPTVYSN